MRGSRGSGWHWRAGRISDATGSFDLTFLIVIGLFVTAIAALLLARPLKWDTVEAQPATTPAGSS